MRPKGLLEIKKLWKYRLSSCFSKAKTEEWDQKSRRFSDKYGMVMPGLDTYFLEVNAHVSLKVATDDCFRDKESMKI